MKKLFLFTILISGFLLSCANTKVESVPSPCVARNGGPCERRPVNDLFLKDIYAVARM